MCSISHLPTFSTHCRDSMSANLAVFLIVNCEVKASEHKLQFHVAPLETSVEVTLPQATGPIPFAGCLPESHSSCPWLDSCFALSSFLVLPCDTSSNYHVPIAGDIGTRNLYPLFNLANKRFGRSCDWSLFLTLLVFIIDKR